MKQIIAKLKEWHFLHTWGDWKSIGVFKQSFVWDTTDAPVGYEAKQIRVCTVCMKMKARTIEL